MCGILGCINYSELDFAKSKELLRHRGPDETGEFYFENLFLYHARLSILDIKNGQQPFYFNDFVLVFNGQIYNHLDLRAKYNLKCNTNSDTETLVKLYAKIGKDALEQIDGMFAFAILDKTRGKLVLARDRAGEKPLYYYLNNRFLIFGSELNSVVAPLKPEINHTNIYQYLRYSFINSNTPYKDVYEVLAGSWLEIDIRTLGITYDRWWKIEDMYQKESGLSYKETLDLVESYLTESVKRRLGNSDLEVGTFLSGGIDSGLVTAISSTFQTKLKTFTVSFEGLYNEVPLASLVAKRYSTDHYIIPISFAELKNELIGILTNYGEPYADSSAIPSFYVAREAKKFLTVILNGDGADELFGGYRRYVPFLMNDFFDTGNLEKSIAKSISKILPNPNEKKSKYNYIYRLLEFSSKLPLQCYLSATVDYFEGYEKYLYNDSDPLADIEKYLKLLSYKKISGLRKIMCTDFKFLLSDDLLVKMDIATMANSLEGRTPFLSKAMLDFAPSIKDQYKIKGFNTKFLLRELGRKYLPAELINQPKRGFEVPLRSWIENDLKEMVFDYLNAQNVSELYINKKFINNLLEGKANVPPEKRAKMLWVLLALEIWYKHCYKNL